MAQQSRQAVCYDFDTVSKFCRSTALAVAFQQHTKLEWVEYRDSAVLNAIYSVMFGFGPPGVAEVHQASKERIEETADQLHLRYLLTWLSKMHEQGPGAAYAYIEELLKLRSYNLEAVQEVFRDAHEINQAVLGETRTGIERLASIRLFGTVGVAMLGAAGAIVLAPAGILICGGISLSYQMTYTMVKEWEKGPVAQAVGISMEAGKEYGSQRLEGAAGAVEARALARGAKAESIVQSCEGQIRKYSQRLAQEGWRKKQLAKARSIVGRQKALAAKQAQVIGQAARTAKLARGFASRGVPVIFAVWDIFDAMSDYDETVGQQ